MLFQMSQTASVRSSRVEDVEKLFRSFDADRSGSLSMAELTAYLRSRWSKDTTPAQARKIMRKSDRNIDWLVNLDEFLGCASDPVACENPTVPHSAPAQEAGAGKFGGAATLKQELLANAIPDQPSEEMRPSQVERCSKADRSILRRHGLDIESQEASSRGASSRPPLDPVHGQAVQVRGSWVQTLIMPDSCRNPLAHVGSIDQDGHAQCLQESLKITMSCGQCHANYLHNMVHNCASACMPSMRSPSCLKCSQPLKLLECVVGQGRVVEMNLTSADIAGERDEGGDMVVVGADTLTGELILRDRKSEEARAEADKLTQELPALVAALRKERQQSGATVPGQETKAVDPLAEASLDDSSTESTETSERESYDPLADEE